VRRDCVGVSFWLLLTTERTSQSTDPRSLLPLSRSLRKAASPFYEYSQKKRVFSSTACVFTLFLRFPSLPPFLPTLSTLPSLLTHKLTQKLQTTTEALFFFLSLIPSAALSAVASPRFRPTCRALRTRVVTPVTLPRMQLAAAVAPIAAAADANGSSSNVMVRELTSAPQRC
jgi:hypothetical protein